MYDNNMIKKVLKQININLFMIFIIFFYIEMHQPNIMKERYGQEQYKNLSENKKTRYLSVERDTIKRKKTKNFHKHLKWYLSYQFFEKE